MTSSLARRKAEARAQARQAEDEPSPEHDQEADAVDPGTTSGEEGEDK